MSEEHPDDARRPERPTAWKGLLREAFGPASVPPAAQRPASRESVVTPSTRFATGDEIARDGTSVLLRGRDLEMDREVSLRILEAETNVSRFLERIQIGAQLQHPGIVPVYAFGLLDDGRAFVARRLVEGETFAELLARETGTHRLLAILEQAAHALAFAHARGVAHGYVTAERIVVGPHGEVLVTGWDRAVRANGDPAPLREDIRALGRLLASLDGRLDCDLAELARRCGADDPTERPRHAGEIARAIGDALTNHERSVREAEIAAMRERSRADAEGRRAKRQRRWAAAARRARRRSRTLAAMALLAVVLGLVGWIWKSAEERSSEELADAEVAAALREAVRHQGAAEWAEARGWAQKAVALARASARSESLEPARALLEEIERERQRVEGEARALARLEAVWVNAEFGETERLESEFREAFQDCGIDPERMRQERVKPRVVSTELRVELAAALDRWSAYRASSAANVADPGALLEIARALDTDDWRDRLRAVATTRDRAECQRLVESADVATLPAGTLLLLVSLTDGRVHESLFLEYCRRHPDDAALNWALNWGPQSLERADVKLTAALALRPDSYNLLNNLGNRLSDRGRFEEADAALRRAIRLEPENWVAHMNLGNSLSAQGRLEEAVAAHRRAADLEPGQSLIQHNLGICLRKQGRLEGAIAAFSRAIEIEPERYWPHVELGVALWKTGSLEDAARTLRGAIKRVPERFEAHVNLAYVLMQQDDLDSCLETCRKAIELGPDDARPYLALACVLGLRNDLDGAISACSLAAEREPIGPAAYCMLANSLFPHGQREMAIAVLRRATRLQPNSADTQANLCRALLATRGLTDEAINAGRRAIEIDPDSAFAHMMLSSAYFLNDQLKEAVEICERAVELRPDSARYHAELGGLLTLQQGKLEKAISACRRAIRIEPREPMAHINLGDALLKQGKPDEAIVAYQRAVEIEPSDAYAHLGLGDALLELGKPDEAIAAYERAIELDPECYDALFALGNLFVDGGQLPEAVRLYRRAIAVHPDRIKAHGMLGVALEKQGNLIAAIDAYHDAIKADPDCWKAPCRLGSCYLKLNRLDEAISAYRAAVRLGATHHVHWNNLGVAHLRKGEYAKAAVAFLEAIDLDPGYVQAWENLGLARKREGQYEKAIEALRRAIELDPKCVAARVNLGAILCDKLRDFDGAIREFRAALRLDPKNGAFHFNLGNAYKGKGNYEGCLAQYREAIGLGYGGALANYVGVLADCPDPTLRDPDEAISIARRLLESTPSPYLRLVLGIAYQRAKRPREAIQALKMVIMDSKNLAAERDAHLAMAHARLDEWEKAASCYERCKSWFDANAADDPCRAEAKAAIEACRRRRKGK